MKIYFSENLKRLRTQKGLTQEKLANFIGVSYQTISKWENSDTYPDITTLPAIAKFFNVSVDELLGVNQAENEAEIAEQIEVYDNLTIEKSDLLLFESNHDIEMLKKGPYPPHLKVRILSDKGHISNNACSAELGSLLQKGTTRFILGHLSQHNNIPMLAKKTAEAALIDIGAENEKDYKLSVAAPFGNGVSII